MNIFINRRAHTRYGVDGQLSINGSVICDTCEHPHLHLPEGMYRVEIRHNRRLRRKVPTLMADDVRRSAFPIIGIGNGPFLLTDGSIIVGHRLMKGVLTHSSAVFAHLIDRLDKVANRRENITLIIQ